MVKINLRGMCKHVLLSPDNGVPAQSVVRVELDHDIPVTYESYDIRLFVPTEFATLLEIGLPITVTLEQNGN